ITYGTFPKYNQPQFRIFLQFSKNIFNVFAASKPHFSGRTNYLLGNNNEKPNLTRANYQNISGFVEPVAKDKASQVNINTVVNGNISYVFGLNSIDANAVQNAARREIELLAEPITGTYRNVVFYWYQARNDAASQFGDKVIIESISPSPVKAIFDSEKVKGKAVWCEENPLTSGYIADVSIETIQGKPVLYKILDVHERIEYPVQTTLLNK
ncbi:MAG: hypothetical protein KBA28_05450, partial [Syntrophaceae bacterium]|nr:hypothetical protein [Syntrophaceae bacterium]